LGAIQLNYSIFPLEFDITKKAQSLSPRLIYQREWNSKNPAKAYGYVKKYYKNNPEIYLKKLEQRREEKRLLVETFGGRCQSCGYDKCIQALEFHHKDRNQKKDFLKDKPRTAKFRFDILKLEIISFPERFTLLCANCHVEVESDFRRSRGDMYWARD